MGKPPFPLNSPALLSLNQSRQLETEVQENSDVDFSNHLLDRESLNQLSKQELVEIIIEQSKLIRELQKIIYELQQEVERLKVSRDLDSKTSSKPPSGDILKKSENKKALLEEEPNQPKRKPGGQSGYQGKTRKGFSRVDCSIINTLLDERF